MGERTVKRIVVLLLSLLLLPVLRATAGEREIVVKGSDTIGEHLGQDIARSFMAERPGTRVRWESLGSSTAFVGLFDGSADLGASSRAVKGPELRQARTLGVELEEFVIGYDGIAVIVHPSNPVSHLSIDELSDLFCGKRGRWSQVGGRDRPVRPISRPSYSGTHSFFKGQVLRKGDPRIDLEFSPRSQFIEETDDIIRRVARDRDAIAYVGLGFVKGAAVKILAVAGQQKSRAVEPSPETVRDGSYPIYRPLYLYARSARSGLLDDFVSFVLSAEGRRLVAASGFVPSDVQTAVVAGDHSESDPQPPRRVFFPFNRTQLDAEAFQRLDGVVRALRRGGYRARIVGHADSVGGAAVNEAISRERARQVFAYLRQQGVAAGLLELSARGYDEPIATNDSDLGRSKNRRVDVYLIEKVEGSTPDVAAPRAVAR